MRSYTSTHRFTRDAPVSSLNDLAKRETSLDHLDTDSRKVMTLARQEAIQNGHSYIGTEHLAVALRLHRTPILDKIWGELPVDLETLRRRIEVAVPPTLGTTMPTRLRSTPRVGTILTMARVLAANSSRDSPEAGSPQWSWAPSRRGWPAARVGMSPSHAVSGRLRPPPLAGPAAPQA